MERRALWARLRGSRSRPRRPAHRPSSAVADRSGPDGSAQPRTARSRSMEPGQQDGERERWGAAGIRVGPRVCSVGVTARSAAGPLGEPLGREKGDRRGPPRCRVALPRQELRARSPHTHAGPNRRDAIARLQPRSRVRLRPPRPKETGQSLPYLLGCAGGVGLGVSRGAAAASGGGVEAPGIVLVHGPRPARGSRVPAFPRRGRRSLAVSPPPAPCRPLGLCLAPPAAGGESATGEEDGGRKKEKGKRKKTESRQKKKKKKNLRGERAAERCREPSGAQAGAAPCAASSLSAPPELAPPAARPRPWGCGRSGSRPRTPLAKSAAPARGDSEPRMPLQRGARRDSGHWQRPAPRAVYPAPRRRRRRTMCTRTRQTRGATAPPPWPGTAHLSPRVGTGGGRRSPRSAPAPCRSELPPAARASRVLPSLAPSSRPPAAGRFPLISPPLPRPAGASWCRPLSHVPKMGICVALRQRGFPCRG